MAEQAAPTQSLKRKADDDSSNEVERIIDKITRLQSNNPPLNELIAFSFEYDRATDLLVRGDELVTMDLILNHAREGSARLESLHQAELDDLRLELEILLEGGTE
jgi:hypothetical protein